MSIDELFTDNQLVEKIQKKLPELFYLAELESSRAGKVGMEVGSAREKILIALLIYKFGQENVETNIPITEAEIDVKVFGNPVSIKTMTGKRLGGVKLIWTVDAEKAMRFSNEYVPSCDTILAQVNWGDLGWLFYFPRSIQMETLQQIGRERYIKLPIAGTNPRGVEISAGALNILANHPRSLKIPVKWYHTTLDYNPYERWLELWKRE
ncbi:MAG: type II restriction endonuclease subunit R [Chloroflexi bacterium RBG_16_54_18]|nr:MAG: type II restriction endonuclease subunit R [Chloroflexi bacterium RBG_16_54_18]